MKKLYAKASFKSKKPSHKNSTQDCVDGGIYISKPQHGPIILAYQSGSAQQQTPQSLADIDVSTSTMRRKHRKSTPEVAQSAANSAAASNEDESFFPPPPSRTPSSASSLSASNPAIARLYQPDDSHYYYSIQELQQLNMLDHRHPHFHRHQQQQQHQLLHQSNSATTAATVATAPTTTFYEHHKLVLQLPMAATTPTSPIYEAPHIVNNSSGGGGVGARSLDYSYNTHHPPLRSYLAADDIEGNDLDKDSDFMLGSDGRMAGFGSLPIVDAEVHARRLGSASPLSMSQRSSTLSFSNSRKLQHTHSMPSICLRNDRSVGGEGDADDDYGDDDSGGLQQLHAYRQQQLKLQQQQQEAQHKQHYHPQTTRHNSVKANLISNWPTITANANGYVEQSIIGARASVMVYDDNLKRWLPSGTSAGLSKVQIYHHQQNNTFRIVGRKLQDHEVVINCSILKGLKYNQATPTFHQWRDSKFVYGLNFSSQNDADAFARAMVHALDVLSGRLVNNPAMGGAMGMGLPTNGNGYEEDMGYRTMTSEDAAILRQQQQITGQITPSAQTPTSQANQNNIPQSPPTPQGHHRTSRNSLSAPAAPQPQQMTIPQQQPQPPYGQAGQPNGLQPQTHVPPVPGQPQYHAPQQMQQAPQASHAVYSAQQLVNAGYPQQSQYQPSHFMLSNSNPNLNLHQYSQQQQPPPQCIPGAPQPPMPPPHQNGIGGGGGGGGPIYVSSSQSQPALPTSVSSSSGIYGGQPIQMQQPQAPSGVLQNGSGGGGGVGVTAAAGAAAAPPPPPPPPFGGIGAPAPPMMGGSSVPPAPMPPPANANRSAPQAPAAPPPPPAAAAPPPPPPPPAGGAPSTKKDDPQADLMGSLAAQLQQAKLKKNKPSAAPTENSGSSTSSGGSGNYGTIGRSSTGMASMMDEMAKTLARRRAQAEKKEPEAEPEVKQRPWEKSNTLPHKLGSSSSNTNCNASSNTTSNSGSESPRPMRKRFGSASEETILKQVNGDGLSLALSSTELDTLKADILKEIRSEIQKVKQEIIEVIKSEFNRR
ncbi:protein enabled isoform X3 [Zeugodacus cucurbitae]|uniref:protein enabled isoform X3 n=1 Tax=Zeugodacus cucurbitae TaxID=28588 RepID=UPI0023D93492|nr:protein enabled isoform X3 [Zeugodacus cucurbitae]